MFPKSLTKQRGQSEALWEGHGLCLALKARCICLSHSCILGDGTGPNAEWLWNKDLCSVDKGGKNRPWDIKEEMVRHWKCWGWNSSQGSTSAMSLRLKEGPFPCSKRKGSSGEPREGTHKAGMGWRLDKKWMKGLLVTINSQEQKSSLQIALRKLARYICIGTHLGSHAPEVGVDHGNSIPGRSSSSSSASTRDTDMMRTDW